MIPLGTPPLSGAATFVLPTGPSPAKDSPVPPTGVSQTIDWTAVKLDPVWSRVLPASGARRFKVIGICKVADKVIFATSHPDLVAVQKYVATQTDHAIDLIQTDDASLRRLLNQVYLTRSRTGVSQRDGDSCQVVDICDELFAAAQLQGVSDIHLIPGELALQVRFRVDGVLEDYQNYPLEMQAGLISRVKVLAGLNIAEKREPQDGRFSLPSRNSDQTTEVRAATLPTRHGERVTLRLLPPMNDAPKLTHLGMNSSSLELFTEAIQSAHGLILLTGPTGCGKSTTLHTAITQWIQTHAGNVITVEDPIEYEIPGASQVQVDPAEKVSFSRALRSILRHDPDVIMLGEIRDAETAELAIKASLTGHLVFSTLHTNTAAGVVTRLKDMGVPPFLIAATLKLSLAQRLVRKLCPHCRIPTPISSAEALALGNAQWEGRTAYTPGGCVYCAGKGFVGRTALFEMLGNDESVTELVSNDATETELMGYMEKARYPRLMDDGVEKIFSGATTVQQILGAVTRW